MVDIYIFEPDQIALNGLLSVFSVEPDLRVSGYADSPRSLESISQATPDLLLMDLPCLGQSGLEQLQQAKQYHPEIKLVVLTAHADDTDIEVALNAGAKAYLLKGSSLMLLLSAIRAVAMGASWLDPLIARRTFDRFASNHVDREFVARRCDQTVSLSARELEVANLLAEGLSNQEIASRLFLSIETVKTHVRQVMKKYQVSSRTAAAVRILQTTSHTVRSKEDAS